METTEVSFSAKDVMALRQETGMGMMECKKALTITNGDQAAAKEWLRENATTKMEARTERTTGEGRIGIAIDGASAAMVEIQTETDFTAKNEDFLKMVEDVAQAALQQPAGELTASDDMQKRIDDIRVTTRENANFARGVKLEGGAFGGYVHFDGKRAALAQVSGPMDEAILKGICQHIVAMDPAGLDEDDVSADKIQEIRSDAIAEAKETGKPEEIAQKIAEGKVRKFLEENTLLNQKYVQDDSKQIKDLMPSGVTMQKFIRYTLGA